MTPGRAAVVVAALPLLVLLSPLVFIGVNCVGRGVEAGRPSPAVADAAAGVKDYFRSEASTYLTLPEWYIVYATDDYAAFLRTRPPSRFPYFRAVAQYWGYYGQACRMTKRAYPFEPGVHLMLGVIGMSFSVEQVAKGLYESTVGRVIEWIASHETEEDAFAYRTARAYGTFMHTTPWYEFPFGRTLAALWRTTPFWGPHVVRKWERKVVLSAEYGMKGAYAWVIRLGTRAVLGSADLTIHARIANAPPAVFGDPRVRRVKALSQGSYVVNLPRYEAFTQVATRLAAQRVRFLDVAGNDEILVTAIVPGTWRHGPAYGELLFGRPLLADAGKQRIAVKAPVGSLHAILPALERRGARIEHLYDY